MSDCDFLAGTLDHFTEELKEIAIGESLGVSRTPVREALRQLELEGLVEIIPNNGTFFVGSYRMYRTYIC